MESWGSGAFVQLPMSRDPFPILAGPAQMRGTQLGVEPTHLPVRSQTRGPSCDQDDGKAELKVVSTHLEI